METDFAQFSLKVRVALGVSQNAIYNVSDAISQVRLHLIYPFFQNLSPLPGFCKHMTQCSVRLLTFSSVYFS